MEAIIAGVNEGEIETRDIEFRRRGDFNRNSNQVLDITSIDHLTYHALSFVLLLLDGTDACYQGLVMVCDANGTPAVGNREGNLIGDGSNI